MRYLWILALLAASAFGQAVTPPKTSLDKATDSFIGALDKAVDRVNTAFDTLTKNQGKMTAILDTMAKRVIALEARVKELEKKEVLYGAGLITARTDDGKVYLSVDATQVPYLSLDNAYLGENTFLPGNVIVRDPSSGPVSTVNLDELQADVRTLKRRMAMLEGAIVVTKENK